MRGQRLPGRVSQTDLCHPVRSDARDGFRLTARLAGPPVRTGPEIEPSWSVDILHHIPYAMDGYTGAIVSQAKRSAEPRKDCTMSVLGVIVIVVIVILVLRII
jgi:hypothetical protein